MPTPTKGPRLGGGPAHERLILANLATALFEHKRITTTVTKAKRVRPLAERLVTFAKRGDLHSRRRVMTVVRDKGVVHELFAEIAPQLGERQGGYTRITKIGNRKGDNAPMAVIELVLEPLTAKQATVREAEAATRRSARDRGAGAAAAATAAAEADQAADQQVAAEDPAEGSTSPQTAAATDAAQAEGEAGPEATGAQAPAPAAESAATADADVDADQQVPAEDPAEGSTSAQTATAGEGDQAEGDDTADEAKGPQA